MNLLHRMGILTPHTTTAAAVLGGGDVAQVKDLPADVAEAFGINVHTQQVNRRQAMRIPSVRRGRSIIAGSIATFDLVCARVDLGEDGRTATTGPAREQRVRRVLLEQPDRTLPRMQTIIRTVDDLIFYPWSFWRVTERGGDGFPTHAEHVDRSRIRIDHAQQRVYIDNRYVPDADLIRFDGPDEGLLTHGATTLTTALKLEAAVQRFSDIDVPLGVLSDTREGTKRLTDTEVDNLLDRWAAARRKRTTAYLSSLKYEAVQFDATRIQLAEARQQTALDIARHMHLDAHEVNAPSETGMTYSNTESVRRDRVDSLKPYTSAIAERLSMPDVTPRGQRVSFDTAAYVRGTTKELAETAVAAAGGPVMTVDEARARYLDLSPMEGTDAP